MSLYFITGVSGSGKSTVIVELKRRGYEAYDVDEAGPATAKWHHNTTGFIHPKSSIQTADRTPEFLANHSWRVPRQEVTALAAIASTKTIFLGGAIANESELQDFFGLVFALTIDNQTLEHRLTTRTNNTWGKSPHELAQALAWNRKLSKRYKDFGYTIIDANLPTHTIISEILNHIHED